MSNSVPDGWSVAPLEELSNFRRGSFPQPYGNPEWYDDNGYRFVQVYDVGSNNKLKPDTKVRISHQAAEQSVFVPCGTVVVTIQGSIGRVAVTQYDAYFDRTILIFQNISEAMNREFFAIMIKVIFDSKKEEADGGVIKTITKETLRSFNMIVPPLPEQQKIAEILSSVDDVIEKTQAQIDKLKDLKTGMMQELLTKGIGHTEFKDSPVGRIPVEWDVQLLGSVCSFTQGVQISSDNMIREQRDGYIRYMYIRDFTGDDRLWFVEDCYPNKIITDADLAMANTGHSSGTVYKGKHGVLSNNAFKISFNQNTLNTDFLYYFLQSGFFLRKIQQLFNTAGQPHVGHANIAKMPVPIPSIKEQAKIAHAINQIVKSESEKFKKYGQLINLKKALMQDLLTGKVRVKVDQ